MDSAYAFLSIPNRVSQAGRPNLLVIYEWIYNFFKFSITQRLGSPVFRHVLCRKSRTV